MEKLISLLNEYKEDALYVFVEYNKELHWFDMLDDGKNTFLWEETILWKRYGFIKWLVDNDKIDIKELVKWEIKSWWEFEEYPEITEISEEHWNKYYSELCLMLLSIQDNPIEFLLSILG